MTMMITRHGIRLIASPSSAHLVSTRITDADERAMPMLTSQKIAPVSEQHGDHAERHPLPAVERLRPRGRRRRRRRRAWPPALGEQLQAAEQEIAAERDERHARAGWTDRSAIS